VIEHLREVCLLGREALVGQAAACRGKDDLPVFRVEGMSRVGPLTFYPPDYRAYEAGGLRAYFVHFHTRSGV
jgi:hypothetical protein